MKRLNRSLLVLGTSVALALPVTLSAQTNPFRPIHDWGELPDDRE